MADKLGIGACIAGIVGEVRAESSASVQLWAIAC